MAWLVSVAGAVLVLAVLQDIFHTLWHPSGRGRITRVVMVAVWRAAGRSGRTRARELAGPLAMVCVVMTWTGLVVVGWTLVYLPHMPDAFAFSPGLDAASRSALLDSLYLSTVSVSTLGYGDIVPTAGWLCAVAPLQALVGFVLLTAAVSWVLQVYPALARRRALAIRLAMLEGKDAARTLHELEPASAARLLDVLAGDLIQIRVDLTQYEETYYYGESDPKTALPATLPYLRQLGAAGRASRSPTVRSAAETLDESLEDFCVVLRDQHGRRGEDVVAVLRDYAKEHGHDRPGREC